MTKNKKIYYDILTRFGGDPQPDINETDFYKQMESLIDREFYVGAYWMYKLLYPKQYELLNRLSTAQNKYEMVLVLRKYLLTNEL